MPAQDEDGPLTPTGADDASAPPRLGVVMPLANERATIDELLAGVLAQVGAQDRVFCVVDRVSTDGTLDRIREHAAKDPRVVAVWAPENRCVVDAYFRGYREALANDCEWILEMDGGLSHRPDEIPRFMAAMKTGVDYAAGSRFIPGGSHHGSWWRRLVSRGGTILTNLLLGTRMKDMTSGFECFTRRAMTEVVNHGVRSRAHFFQTEIRVLLRDWAWAEVPITYRNPSAGLSRHSLAEALHILWSLYRQQRGHAGQGAR